jgi:hypothetical protein
MLYYNFYSNTTAVPRGLPTNIYDGKDELYPVYYCRNTTIPYYNENLSLPPSMKGSSVLMRAIASARNQFDTFNVGGARTKIASGTNPVIALPWNGDLINLS